MKKDIHPDVQKATVRCACGNEVQLFTAKGKEMNVEICAACHPFYTGKQRFLDSAGRIDRFKKKYASFSKEGK